ncbi:MAG: biotin carboxylase N-terminal domain-containing protein [Acidimicrobiales bacterium]
MFGSVLVANRGEIAVRVCRTLHRLGIESIAIYSDADRDAFHVKQADRSVRVGPPPVRESYLAIDAIVDAAHSMGAEAVHPGYGFLSENAQFAAACGEAGLAFVGPPVAAISAMGDKIRARKLASESGVPVVPGRDDPAMTDAELVEAAREIGFPVLIKPSAGGGGKGMRSVAEASELERALQASRRESLAAFGDDSLFVERFLERPRHVEVQVLADSSGKTLHLFERECSLQRRHQKIVEETPSPLIDAPKRAVLGEHAITVAKACGYVGAGTVEFLIPSGAPDEHFFLEMNTRLQVEHPVTEMILGLDLVEWQLRISAGERLDFDQASVVADGHAIEARVYAEDPLRGFLPTGGTIVAYREPIAEHIRVDSGIEAGSVVTDLYDPLLAKVIAWGPERETALDGLKRALDETSVLGVRTNLAYLVHLLEDPHVRAGELDTGLAERALSDYRETPLDDDVVAAAALALVVEDEPTGPVADPWSIPGGWRVAGPAFSTRTIEFGSGERYDVRWRGRARSAEIAIGDSQPRSARVEYDAGTLVVFLDGLRDSYVYVRVDAARFLGRGPTWWTFRVVPAFARAAEDSSGGGDGTVRSPMPGAVVSVEVSKGDDVETGEVLFVVEAMKMEHTVVAPVAGTVTNVRVAVGDRVRMDEEIAVIEEKRNGTDRTGVNEMNDEGIAQGEETTTR